MGFCALLSYASEPDSIKASNHTKELNEVVVTASYLTREDDHILAVPTKEQRKHAVTGYDLLQNLMIPGISVDRATGSVTTPTGAATLYIDGREADFREVQSLRPKDIARVEYFDIPTGKYANDMSAINFVLKKLDNGGYTQLDATQGVGYQHGDYNLISKFVTGTKSINLWAGYAVDDPESSMDERETFYFSDGRLTRNSSYRNDGNRKWGPCGPTTLRNRRTI